MIRAVAVAVIVSFCVGWLLGSSNWQAIKRNFNNAYMIHYFTRSGANIDRYIYYVHSDNETALRDFGELRTEVLKVESTGFSTLFNVHLEADSRKVIISPLRELDGVSAVFTIPFMCH